MVGAVNLLFWLAVALLASDQTTADKTTRPAAFLGVAQFKINLLHAAMINSNFYLLTYINETKG